MAPDLAGLRAGKPFTAFGAFQLRPSLYKELHCKGFNHDGESSALRESFFPLQ